MARAKRTDRADARRRYRQAMAEAEEQGGDDLEAGVGTSATADHAAPRKDGRPRPQTTAQTPPSRMSLLDSIRWAYQPADIRGDLALVPWLVTRTKAIWLPALLTVTAAIAFLFLGPQENALALLAFQAFVVPPPMAAAFLAGLLTPRAAWLAGGITGMIGALVYVAVILVYPETATSSSGGAAARQGAAVFALLLSPTVGLAVGAFAGFYRRFLRAANPNQQRPTKSQRRTASRSDARR